MRKHRSLELAVVSVWLLSVALSAQGRYSFDLDVPGARFSFWKIEDIGPATSLVADLEVRELRRDSQFKPTFQVALFKGDKNVALIFAREDGWKLKKRQRFQLQMDWKTAGMLAVTSDGMDWGRFPLGFSPESLTIAASTTQLSGHSLSLAGQ